MPGETLFGLYLGRKLDDILSPPCLGCCEARLGPSSRGTPMCRKRAVWELLPGAPARGSEAAPARGSSCQGLGALAARGGSETGAGEFAPGLVAQELEEGALSKRGGRWMYELWPRHALTS